MNSKITAEHLHRGAIVYVRQSTLGQVLEHTESSAANTRWQNRRDRWGLQR